jgi:Holliday junction resolvasome RuvABC endonuclease subunit
MAVLVSWAITKKGIRLFAIENLRLKMCKLTLGLDQSSQVSAYCIAKNGTIQDYGVLKFSNANPNKRISRLKLAVRDLAENHSVDEVILEDIQKQGSIVGYRTLAMVLGVLIDLCIDLGLPYKIVSSSTWRAHYGLGKSKGKGHKKREELKADAVALCQEKYGISATDDEAEAILLTMSQL